MQLLRLLRLVAYGLVDQEQEELKLSDDYTAVLRRHQKWIGLAGEIRARRLRQPSKQIVPFVHAQSFLEDVWLRVPLLTKEDLLHAFLAARTCVTDLNANELLATRKARARALMELLRAWNFCYVVNTRSTTEPDLLPLFFPGPNDRKTGFAFCRNDEWMFLHVKFPEQTYFLSPPVSTTDLDWPHRVEVQFEPTERGQIKLLTQHVSYKQMAAVALDFRLVLCLDNFNNMAPPPSRPRTRAQTPDSGRRSRSRQRRGSDSGRQRRGSVSPLRSSTRRRSIFAG